MNILRKKTTATLLIAIFMISTLAVAMPVSAADFKYSYSTTVGIQLVSIVVAETETAITWTIDYPLEGDYLPAVEGNGQMTVGLIIALDGNGNDPAYQIHNNDGTDHDYEFGMWLYSVYDEGWHSSTGGNNIPVDDVALDWVSCTGGRYNENNPDGLFTITIDKSELGDDFHWALNLAIGTGFVKTYLTYEQMACPVATPGPSFNWGTPIVDDIVKNYEYVRAPDAIVMIDGEAVTQFIRIVVDPTEVHFGPIIEGSTGSRSVNVVNHGNVPAYVTAELMDEKPAGFYTDNFKMDTKSVKDWSIASLTGTQGVDLTLYIPMGTPPGTKTAVLVFWAEIATP